MNISGASAAASSKSRTFSSSVSVDPSPVVPATTTPSDPFSARNPSRRTNASSSIWPFGSNGVTIAVRTPPIDTAALSQAPRKPRRPLVEWPSGMATSTTERDYSHRSTVQKLAVQPDQRLEVAGDVGAGLRRELREVLGRGFIKSGELDGAIALVESIDEAKELLERYRPRLRDTGYIWFVTWKRGHDGYLDQ